MVADGVAGVFEKNTCGKNGIWSFAPIPAIRLERSRGCLHEGDRASAGSDECRNAWGVVLCRFAGLHDLMAHHHVNGDIRCGHGPLWALKLVSDRATKATINKKTMSKVHHATYQAYVMIRISSDNGILSPPVGFSKANIAKILSVLEAGFSAI